LSAERPIFRGHSKEWRVKTDSPFDFALNTQHSTLN
jgi:hypothetical protein